MTDQNDNDSENRVSLSRRKALAGLGTIGAAAGIGGLGTIAQFSDTEEQTAAFTAGAIDGTLVTNATYNGEDLDGSELAGYVTYDGEGPGAHINFEDVKPGDYGTFNFTLEVTNNPAWVGACLGMSNNYDWWNFEPETEVDQNSSISVNTDDSNFSTSGAGNSGPPSSGGYKEEGELAENIWLIPFYDNNADSQFFDSGSTPSTYTSTTAIASPSGFWSNSQGGGGGFTTQPLGNQYLAPRRLTKIVSQPFESTEVYNANQTSDFQTVNAPGGSDIEDGCILLNGDPTIDTGDNTQPAAPLEPGTTLNFGFDWHVPFDVGNEVMGDTLDASIGFSFSQVRNAEGPQLQNTYSPGTESPSAGN